jgi:hypothetical protein
MSGDSALIGESRGESRAGASVLPRTCDGPIRDTSTDE